MLISVAVNINLFQACVYETRFNTKIFDKVHSLLQAHFKYIISVVGKIRTEIQKKEVPNLQIKLYVQRNDMVVLMEKEL